MFTDKKSNLKAFLIALFFIIIAIPTVFSVNRIISDTEDTYTALIRNSKGNQWEPTGANIQLAIDDLNGSGTVWLSFSRNYTVTSTIDLKSNTVLDMQGATVMPSGNFDVISMGSSSQITDGIINVSSVADFSSSAIKLSQTGITGRATMVRNMRLVSGGLRGRGIYLNTGEAGNVSITGALFDNIKTKEFEYALLVNQTSPNGSVNGNSFYNFFGSGDKYFVTLYEVQGEASGNYFHNMQCNCSNDTEYVVWNNGRANTYDTIMAYNWDSNGGARASYNFSGSGFGHGGAHQCYLSFGGGNNDLEFGAWSLTNNSYTIVDFENSSMTLGYVNQLG